MSQRKIRFVNSGWGGDEVVGGFGGTIDVRLARDVLAYRPTAITIMLGMNDAGYRPFDSGLLKGYREGYAHILSALQSAVPGIKITAVQPSPFDDFTRPPQFDGGYNNVLVRFGQEARFSPVPRVVDSRELASGLRIHHQLARPRLEQQALSRR